MKSDGYPGPQGRDPQLTPVCDTKFWVNGEREPHRCTNPVDREGELCSDVHALAHTISKAEVLEAALIAIEWKKRPVTQSEVHFAATYGLHKDVNPRQIGFRLQQLADDESLVKTSIPRRQGRGFPYLWATASFMSDEPALDDQGDVRVA